MWKCNKIFYLANRIVKMRVQEYVCNRLATFLSVSKCMFVVRCVSLDRWLDELQASFGIATGVSTSFPFDKFNSKQNYTEDVNFDKWLGLNSVRYIITIILRWKHLFQAENKKWIALKQNKAKKFVNDACSEHYSGISLNLSCLFHITNEYVLANRMLTYIVHIVFVHGRLMLATQN